MTRFIEKFEVIGLVLPDITGPFASDPMRFITPGRWPADTIQARFLRAPTAFAGPGGESIYFAAIPYEAGYSGPAGGNPTHLADPDRDFGGYAGFEIGNVTAAHRELLLASIDDLAGEIVTRLAKLGFSAEDSEVKHIKFEIEL
jgi:hypothetical protein